MTCIVGIETPDGVLIGADSIAVAGWTANIRGAAEPKLFRLREYIIGFTSSYRMGDLLRYHLTIASPPKTRLHRHMVVNVVPAIRACLKDGGFATTKDGAEVGGAFLVGVRGRVYLISQDYQVDRSTYGYNVTGMTDQALGSLASTEGEEPRARIRKALEAAERHSIGVRRPWRFLAGTR